MPCGSPLWFVVSHSGHVSGDQTGIPILNTHFSAFSFFCTSHTHWLTGMPAGVAVASAFLGSRFGLASLHVMSATALLCWTTATLIGSNP